MGKSRAEIQAAYRARKRQRMGEEAFLSAERNRVKKYYIPVAKLTKKDAKERNSQVNKRVKKHRERVKRISQEIQNQRNLEVVNSDLDDQISADDSAVSDISYSGGGSLDHPRSPLRVKMSFKKKSSRKRVSRCLTKAHKNIEALTLKLQAATKEKKKIQKRYERLREQVPMSSTPKEAVSSRKNTPRSKTNSQLKHAGLDPTQVPQEIRKKLIFSNVIISEIRNVSQHTTRRVERAALHKIVSGSKVLKKYRLIRLVQRRTGMGRANLSKSCHFLKTRKEFRPSWAALHQEVVQFLERDDNSRMCPGKKDSCKTNQAETRRQKRFLNDYIGNLHAKYVAEHPEKRRVSLSAFRRIRSNLCPHIKLVHFAARNRCLCQKHQNMSLKLKALRRLGTAVSTDSPDEFFKNNTDVQVDHLLTGLQDEQIHFEEWARVEVEGTKKTKIVQLSLTRADFTSRFKKDMTQFRQHVLLIKNQFEALTTCKNNLPSDKCIVQMDFAENYVCVPLEEVQSGYWGQEGVTIHPIVVYFRDDNCLVHKSFVCTSDEKGHNSSTVLAILTQLIPKLKELVPGLSKVHYWTDSPTSQYRNKTIFSVLCDHAQLFDGPSAQWNYFEAGHGKGPCDGIGGTVKRLADEAVKRNITNIQDAKDFYAWACQERHESSGSKIVYFFVSKADCAQSSQLIAERWPATKSFPGTLQAHAVIGLDNALLMRQQSCYCAKCWSLGADEESNTQTMCEGWQAFGLSGGRANQGKEAPPNKTTQPEMKTARSSAPAYAKDDWVAAVYEAKWYIGRVIERDKKEVHINFMAQCVGAHREEKFKWPNRKDAIWVPNKAVLCHIEEPKRDAISKRLFSLSMTQKDIIQNAFKEFLSQK